MAHPVVVACLLYCSTEVEAAAGHTRIFGALDVPVEAKQLSLPSSTLNAPLVHGVLPEPTMSFQYLARLGTSGLVLSITTCFPCLSASWHELTQRCQEPSVSWGDPGQITSQSGEFPSLNSGRDGGVQSHSPCSHGHSQLTLGAPG